MLILQALGVTVRGAGLKPVTTVVNVMIHRESLMFTIFNFLKCVCSVCASGFSPLCNRGLDTRHGLVSPRVIGGNTVQNNLNIFSHFCDVDKTRAHLIYGIKTQEPLAFDGKHIIVIRCDIRLVWDRVGIHRRLFCSLFRVFSFLERWGLSTTFEIPFSALCLSGNMESFRRSVILWSRWKTRCARHTCIYLLCSLLTLFFLCSESD
jgi:hypothetical protein